jgi:integrase
MAFVNLSLSLGSQCHPQLPKLLGAPFFGTLTAHCTRVKTPFWLDLSDFLGTMHERTPNYIVIHESWRHNGNRICSQKTGDTKKHGEIMGVKLRIRKRLVRGQIKWELDLRELKAGRRYFPIKQQAETVRFQKLSEYEKHGPVFANLSEREGHDFASFRDRIGAIGMSMPGVALFCEGVHALGLTLPEALLFLEKHHHGVQKKKLADAINECLAGKRQSGRRKRSVDQFGYVLKSFLKDREDKLCSDITPAEIEAWLHKPELAQQTRKGKLTVLRTFFKWVVRRGYIHIDPTAKIEKIMVEHSPPGILTVEEASRLMAAAQEHCPCFVPYLAACLFAGVRPAEVMRLTWASFDLDEGSIRIEPAQSKTRSRRSRRIVELEPNAIEWLKFGKDAGVTIAPRNMKRHFDRVRLLAGITSWDSDCMRHSYCSYHLPIHGAMKTAANAGHSETVLFNHYRELVKLADAKRFWEIRPVQPGSAAEPESKIINFQR